jgi:hypothetical protein
MARNQNPQFAGLQTLKDEHAAQIKQFEDWARRGYGEFHHNHYDWWAFPIDEPSSKGFRYVVLQGDIDELKRDKAFMNRYIKGIELLCASWGWDLKNSCDLRNVNEHQRWQVFRVITFHDSFCGPEPLLGTYQFNFTSDGPSVSGRPHIRLNCLDVSANFAA